MRKPDEAAQNLTVGATAAKKLYAAPTSGGSVLPSTVRSKFEDSLGLDLGNVRVHTGSSSAVAARAVGAKAFAVGNDIHFGAGQFDVSSPQGKHLLAHEVAHTVQQDGATPVRQNKLELSQGNDPQEIEADRAADAMVTGAPTSVGGSRSVSTLFREADPTAPPETEPKADPASDQKSDADKSAEADPISDADKQRVKAAQTTLDLQAAKLQTITSAAAKVSAAIKSAHAGGVTSAATSASAKAQSVNAALNHVSKTLATISPEAQENSASVASLVKAQKSLKTKLDAAVKSVSGALVVPGGAAAASTSPTALTTLAASVATVLRKAKQLQGSVAQLASQSPAQQILGVKAALATLGAMGSSRTFALKLAKSTASADVAAALGGDFSALDKKKKEAEAKVGVSGGASKASPSPSTPTGGAKSFSPTDLKKAEEGTKLRDAQDKVDTSVSSDGEVSAGAKDLSVGPGKLSAKGTADAGLREDGSLELQGVKFEPGYTMAGPTRTVSVAGSAGRSVSVSPPVFDGTRWTVSYTITWSGGVKGKGGKTGGKLSGGAGVSGQKSFGGSRTFGEQSAAKAFYDKSGFTSQDMPAGIPSLDELTAMKEGESRSESLGGEIGPGASGTATGVTVSAGASFGGKEEIELKKEAGEKVSVTIRDSTTWKVNAGAGAGPVAAGVGGAKSNATSTTATFDLSTEAGKAAYAAWQAAPGKAPPAGSGVTLVSHGKGKATSRKEGLSVWPASGSDTVTTGEHTESSTDGKHTTKTTYGQWQRQTEQPEIDGSKKYGVGNDKHTETHQLQVTTKDGGTPEFVVDTSIDKKGDAAATSEALANEDAAGGEKYWKKGEKASGKWGVKSTYTKEQMDQFMKEVEGGKRLKSGVNEVTNDGEVLRKELKAATTEKEKHEALAKWYSEKGPDARADITNIVGEPDKVELSLENDAVLNGAIGQGKFDAAFATIRNTFTDVNTKPDTLKRLASEAARLVAEQNSRVRHVQNPSNYVELPDHMRKRAWQSIQANVKHAFQLERNIRDSLTKEHGVDANVPKELQTARGRASKARGPAETARKSAQLGREVHAGRGSRKKESARKMIHRTSGSAMTAKEMKAASSESKMSGSQKVRAYKGLYKFADKAWTDAQAEMSKGEAAEAKMLRADVGDDASIAAAVQAADKAETHYSVAKTRFGDAGKGYVNIAVMLKAEGELARVKGYEDEAHGQLPSAPKN